MFLRSFNQLYEIDNPIHISFKFSYQKIITFIKKAIMKELSIALLFILFTLSTNAKKIFSVSSQLEAGCRESSKKYLLY